MYRKLIKNDIRKNKLITVAIALFILLAALLTSLAIILAVNLSSAINQLMVEAKTTHFMQMHVGDIDENRLSDFAMAQNVEEFQVLEFLNFDGAELWIGEDSLAGSVQDNGISVQSEKFDFLLDLSGEIVYPNDGEIFVPVYYKKEKQIERGDTVLLYGEPFVVAGFVRDSQMNSALISSKRFLVSATDFEKVREFGILEYLIEFRLRDISALSSFESAYLNAGLESNGPPPVTYSLFKLANGISDGIMIAVLVLISILVIIVTFLCIRFTILAKIQEDYKEIGVLKAIGLRVSTIRKIYIAQYSAITAVACLLGFLLSLALEEPLLTNIRLYMGESNNSLIGSILGALGAAIIFLIIVMYVNRVLREFRKISPAQAIRYGAPKEKSRTSNRFLLSNNQSFHSNIFLGIKDILSRKKLYVTMLLVFIISSFIMIVPQNIYNTISTRNFITYMGIGDCDLRFDIQQTENIPEKATEIAEKMAQDNDIYSFTVLTSMMFDMKREDDSIQRLKVELGDHSAFPITYSSGRAPQMETEIALSSFYADDLEKSMGDEIVLWVDGAEKHLSVCGIYSDLTNGGKTAKAIFETDQTEVLWSIIPVKLQDSGMAETKSFQYQGVFSFVKVSNIDEYIHQTFGTTMGAIRKISYAAVIVTIVLTLLVTVLFIKMLVTKDRYSIAVLKSLGFTSLDIIKQYMTRSIIILALGVVIGIVLSNTLGELVGVALISTFGASAFHFEINPWFAYLFSPLVIAGCVWIATIGGTLGIRSLKIAEHIRE